MRRRERLADAVFGSKCPRLWQCAQVYIYCQSRDVRYLNDCNLSVEVPLGVGRSYVLVSLVSHHHLPGYLPVVVIPFSLSIAKVDLFVWGTRVHDQLARHYDRLCVIQHPDSSGEQVSFPWRWCAYRMVAFICLLGAHPNDVLIIDLIKLIKFTVYGRPVRFSPYGLCT